MIRKTQITVVLLFSAILASAQVKIGANPTDVNPNSILELESSNKGLLLPRVSLTSTTSFAPLAAHVSGMTVYNTATTGDVLPGIYTSNGTKWVAVAIQDTSATAGGIINTSAQTLGAGAKTFTSDLKVNEVTVGKGAGAVYTNTAIGNLDLSANTVGSYNTANGYNALKNNTTGSYNNANGSNALLFNTIGNLNTATGSSTLLFNTMGNFNTAMGNHAIYSNESGNENTAIGNDALLFNTTGSKNTAIGSRSMNGNSTGSYNTSLGSDIYCTGDFSNSTAIGSGAFINSSNTIRIGNSSIISASVQVAWSITSDRRWKSDIKTSNLGLEFIKQLRPVSYLRKNDETKKTEYGFIAQELEETLNKIGVTNAGILSKDGEGMYQVRYNDFIAPMVKAIQEQQTQIEELKALVKQLLAKK